MAPFIPQRPDWKDPTYKDIVRDVFQFREVLPLPLVNYSDVYGTWISFQESKDTQPYMCNCFRDACLGFLRINEQTQTYRLPPTRTLVDHFFSERVAAANTLRAETVEEFQALPLFHARLCHLCNRRVPSVRWSNADEHSIFLQHFGWYHALALYAAGVSPFGDFIPPLPDGELQVLVEVDPIPTRRRLRDYQNRYHLGYGTLDRPAGAFGDFRPEMAEMRVLQHALNRQTKRMQRCLENRLRKLLGFPPHGKTGVSELILFWIVSALFAPAEVFFRARPSFLSGLEIDIFIPSLCLAIEFQGDQHYEPFKHLGGARSLSQVIKRDARKVALCKKQGITLKHFTVADKLTEGYVADKLSEYLREADP